MSEKNEKKWINKAELRQIDAFDSLIEQIGKIRNIDNPYFFFAPDKSALHSPYKLKNISELADRLIKAIENNERIGVSYDIDMDGVSSGTIAMRYLRKFTDNVYPTYHQRSSGHDISKQLHMVDDKTTVMLVMDSSTSDKKSCKTLQDRGVDVLIVDHHMPENDNPYALIVNPCLDDYPNKKISAAGLAWKLCQVLDDKLGVNYANEFLDLASLGMVADVMPVDVLENRYIILAGMKSIKSQGIKEILSNKSKGWNEVSSTVWGFDVAPLVNGVTRQDRIELAINLFLEEDQKKCKEYIKVMNKLLKDAKEKAENLTKMYEESVDTNDKILFAIGEEESKSFNGTIANNLVSKYNRPACVLRRHKGELTGSFRSVKGVDLQQFFIKSGLVKYAAGHTSAGGVCIKESNFEALKQYVRDNFKREIKEEQVEYEIEMSAREVTLDFINELFHLNRVTGEGFPAIKVRVNGLLVGERKTMGADNNHVKLITNVLDVVKFKCGQDYAEEADSMTYIDTVGSLGINKYYHRGKGWIITPQMIMDSYQLAN